MLHALIKKVHIFFKFNRYWNTKKKWKQCGGFGFVLHFNILAKKESFQVIFQPFINVTQRATDFNKSTFWQTSFWQGGYCDWSPSGERYGLFFVYQSGCLMVLKGPVLRI